MEPKVTGFDLEDIDTFSGLLSAYAGIGIQATNLSIADRLIYDMVSDKDTTLFFSFTSNVISSGLREIAAQFIRDAKPKAIITTAGAVEEDVMKSLGNFYIGSFNADDRQLRRKGINRIGNIYVPNERYEQLESFVKPILAGVKGSGPISSLELIEMLSSKVSDPGSFLKAARDVGCKVFCPAITDGALGLQLYFHKQKSKGFALDITADMKQLADISLNAGSTGAVIIGGGVAKHHTIGINIMRGGLDRAVYISTAGEHDASLSGAYPREAVSWGKVKASAKHVLVNDEASVCFPLLALSLHEKLKGG